MKIHELSPKTPVFGDFSCLFAFFRNTPASLQAHTLPQYVVICPEITTRKTAIKTAIGTKTAIKVAII